jgi:hypothetical protein
MSIHDQSLVARRGAAAVGRLTDMPALEAAVILYLRMWFHGGDSRDRVRQDFADVLGEGQACSTMRGLDQFCALLQQHGRRPFVHHGLKCACLGADESCLAQVISSAACGETEDAMLMASLMVRADMAPCLTALATDFGLSVRRLIGRQPRSTPWALATRRPPSASLH